jgi:2-dehydro-3-deoxyphosphooctonate aldolase (KDO 8-P synthase)
MSSPNLHQSTQFQDKIMSSASFPLLLGPCVIESRDLIMKTAEQVKTITDKLALDYPEIVPVFKASYDKANRSSLKSFRGPGLDEGLAILSEVKAQFGLAIVSDVHTEEQIKNGAGEVLDILQIPAFLCRQTDLIVSAANSGKVLNIKKGQFLSPKEVTNIVKKTNEAGNNKVFICERGNSFGYNNLVVDMRMFAEVAAYGIRTIFDATHSCQLPGAGGDKSLGNSDYAPVLARAAVAAGATGLFCETHPDPDVALSDGPNMIPLDKLESAVRGALKVRACLQD